MIANLTQHVATAAQVRAGVVDLHEYARALLGDLLTFHDVPARAQLEERADAVARLVRDVFPNCNVAMVGGAPYFMVPLVEALKRHEVTAVFSFTKRESVDTHHADGSVTKSAVFRHVGWVGA
jgi:hypothetical protein